MTDNIAYYFMGHDLIGNVARVVGKWQYSYLQHATGDWIKHPRVFDTVHFEAACHEITEAEAKKKVELLVPGLKPEWLDNGKGE